MNERRRAPRYEAKNGGIVTLPVPVPVQVVDISATGVLLQATHPVEVGTRGLLRLNLDGVPLQVEVDVQRLAPSTTGRDPMYQIGARIVGMTAEQQRLIDAFTSH